MIDEILRIPKEKILEPLAKKIPGVSPTSVTLVAGFVGVASGVAAMGQHYGIAIGLWGMNRFLDGLDGTMARVNGKQSDLGGYLDIVLDMMVYAALPLGVALGSNLNGIFIALSVMFASFYINSATWMYLSAIQEKRSQGAKLKGELTSVTMPKGIVEGLETIVFYSLFLIFPELAIWLFGLMTVFVVITSLQRVVWAIRHL